jgi:hypothetical protein
MAIPTEQKTGCHTRFCPLAISDQSTPVQKSQIEPIDVVCGRSKEPGYILLWVIYSTNISILAASVSYKAAKFALRIRLHLMTRSKYALRSIKTDKITSFVVTNDCTVLL